MCSRATITSVNLLLSTSPLDKYKVKQMERENGALGFLINYFSITTKRRGVLNFQHYKAVLTCRCESKGEQVLTY